MGQRIAKVVDEQREKRRKSSGDGEIPESPTQALVRAAFELRRSVILAQNELLQSKYHQQLRGYGNQLEGIPSTEANTFFTAKLAAYDEKRGDTPMKYDPVRIVYVIYDVTEVFTYYMWVDRNEQLRHVEAARRKMVFNVDVIGPFKGDFQEIPWDVTVKDAKIKTGRTFHDIWKRNELGGIREATSWVTVGTPGVTV